MSSLFTASDLLFPYEYDFPGKGGDEKILFATREDAVLLALRRLAVMAVSLILVITGLCSLLFFSEVITPGGAGLLGMSFFVLAAAVGAIGWWWVTALWRMSIALITTKRMIKFVYTTPWNKHVLTLPLEMIVDLGAYSKGMFEALFKIGTLTARSSASSSGVATDDPDRVNKKYFYIEHVRYVDDLQHYLQKVLFAFRKDSALLDAFRPFISADKGPQREALMQDYENP